MTDLDVLLCVYLHHPAQLLIELLLGEDLQPGHLSDRVKRAKVNELMGLSHCKVLKLGRQTLKGTGLGLEYRSAAHCLVYVTLPKHGVEYVITRYFVAIYDNLVRNFEALPHGVVF